MPAFAKRLQNHSQVSSKIKSVLLGSAYAYTQWYWFSCDSGRRVWQGAERLKLLWIYWGKSP